MIRRTLSAIWRAINTQPIADEHSIPIRDHDARERAKGKRLRKQEAQRRREREQSERLRKQEAQNRRKRGME